MEKSEKEPEELKNSDRELSEEELAKAAGGGRV